MTRTLGSHEISTDTVVDLRDRLGWSETPLDDMTATVMRLCDIVGELQREVKKLKSAAERLP